jgi:hypothetical protein
MKKMPVLTFVPLLAISVLAGCAGTDVVLKYAPDSFQEITEEYPNLITNTTEENPYYILTVDGETKLNISRDYSLTGAGDITMETPLQPFVDAGLDVSKLGNGFRADGGKFYLASDYGDGTGMKDTAKDSLFESVAAERANLTYHQKMDHYGIKLANGVFEWAKDYTANDKDIVFVLAAQPLRELGVDVDSIQGWTFMTVDNPDGSSTDVVVKAADLDV